MTLGSTWRTMMRSGDTPITRAACTYSLLRSTSVEPRTVRAYCTQPVQRDRDDEHAEGERCRARSGTARGRRRRSAARSGSPGNDSITSQTRMMKRVDPAADEAGDQAERDADHASTAAPTRTPTTSDMRAPYMSADSMSRPWSSVPSRYFGVPPCHPGRRQASHRSAPASPGRTGCAARPQLAKTAQKTQTSATSAAPIATGEVRKLNARRRRRGSAPSDPAKASTGSCRSDVAPRRRGVPPAGRADASPTWTSR